ncbi:MAG: amidohydrolase family protein, partial [Actinobacteria bacterium]|nr:amidohydrolase family protein [Actinomycetota bacterium]
MSAYLISGGTLADNTQKDILIVDEVISEIATKVVSASAASAVVIDARDCIVLPGLVDLHTHLREPGREDSETVASGSRAAARGGFTAVSAMANTFPVADTAGVVEQVYRLGQATGLCDV